MIEDFVHSGLGSKVIFGQGSLAKLEIEIREAGCCRAFLLSTPGQHTKLNAIASSLGSLCAGVFSGAQMHTPLEVTKFAVQLVNDAEADCIVSFGGGSAIGLGKSVSLRMELPHIALPTTYSGSEMTPIVGETDSSVKTTRRNAALLPRIVIYDVDLTLSVPKSVSATSGLNAIAHAVGALYWPKCGPVVHFMAEQGISALFGCLAAVVAAPGDVGSRTTALYGSWLCGSCLGMAPMALHHKLCHVLGGSFDLPHSETHAVLLPHTIAFNANAAPNVMKRLVGAMGSESPVIALCELNKALGVPRSLQALGFNFSDLERATDLVLRDSYQNPRPVARKSISHLLQRAYFGNPPVVEAA